MTNGAAGAAASQQLLAQEEEMTTYTEQDLANDWEFKIVRANTGVFGKSAELNKLLKEEIRAGWVMVEKFDNNRIRFKRRLSARVNDPNLPAEVDPYRVHYGISPTRFGLLIVFLTMGITLGTIFLALVFSRVIH